MYPCYTRVGIYLRVVYNPGWYIPQGGV